MQRQYYMPVCDCHCQSAVDGTYGSIGDIYSDMHRQQHDFILFRRIAGYRCSGAMVQRILRWYSGRYRQ